MFYGLFGMIFYSQKVWGTFQTILEHPLEHKMEVREEQYASCFFVSTCSVKCYRKRPCISRTFFHKIEAINQGCGLSMDTSVFGVLKNLINIHTTS